MCGLLDMDNCSAQIDGSGIPRDGCLCSVCSNSPGSRSQCGATRGDIRPMKPRVWKHICSGTGSRSYHTPRAVLHAHGGVGLPTS